MSLKPHRSVPAAAPQTAQASAARRRANRRNAQKSTGPRTEEGKARVRQNAVKHNLFSRNTQILFVIEELAPQREEFDALLSRLWEHYQPAGIDEELIVDRIAVNYWRLAWVHGESEEYSVGKHAREALLGSYLHAREESRLVRELSRLRRDLEFLQRWGGGAPARERDTGPLGAAARAAHTSPPEHRRRSSGLPDAPPVAGAAHAPSMLPAAPMPAAVDTGVAAPEAKDLVLAAESVTPVEAVALAEGHGSPEFADKIAPASDSTPVAPEDASPVARAAAPATSGAASPVTSRVTQNGIERTQVRNGITYICVDSPDT